MGSLKSMSDRRLIEDFIKNNINSAYRFAFTYTKNQQDAEDVVSESIIKAINASGNLKDSSKVKTWFFRIVSNTAISYINRNKKVIPFDEITDNETYLDSYNFSSLNDVIEKLPKEYLEIITLRYFEDMKLKDISEVIGVNENTVKTRLYKALKILKKEVGDEYEE